MKIGKMFLAVICVILSAVLIAQLYGCGTLIYPERRGQKTGTVDVGIALLDALWLLVFIVPGVVAFAVDFTTGAIYVPGGTKRSSGPGETGKIVVVQINPTELREKTIKEIVMKETGLKELELKQAKIYRLDEKENVEKELSEIAKSGFQAR